MTRLRIVLALLALFNLIPAVAHAQKSSLSGNVWLDLFGGSNGIVIYPQYSFRVDGPRVIITGFGFWERAPDEPDFSDHVNTFTWTKFPYVSLRTEVGGRVREFITHAPDGSDSVLPPAEFFQIGPQVNLHQVFPLKGVNHLAVSYLPALAGIRLRNVILAGDTQKFQLGRGMAVSVEGYRRFFPDERPDYTEIWGLLSVEWLRFTPAVFVLIDGKVKSFAVGGRFAVK